MVPELLFWRDTLDSCHCFVYHLYDFGLRIKMDGIKTQDDSQHHVYFTAMCENLKAIKVKLNQLKAFTFSRYQQNKFALQGSGSVEDSDETFMDGFHEYISRRFDEEQISVIQKVLVDEEYDTESIEMDMETKHDSNIRQCCGDNEHLMNSISDAFNHYSNNVKLLERSFQIGYRFNYWTYTPESALFYLCIK
eukprot:1148929_1